MTTTITGATGIDNIKAATGSVLQVVSTLYTGTVSSTSSTPNDVSGFAATITPSSTSSKILITVNTNFGFDAGDAYPYILLLRGAVSIGTGTGAGSGQVNTFLSGTNVDGDATATSQYKMESASKTYLDSPATTAATTYKIQFSSPFNSHTAYLNRQGSTEAGPYIQFPSSTITLQEIAG